MTKQKINAQELYPKDDFVKWYRQQNQLVFTLH